MDHTVFILQVTHHACFYLVYDIDAAAADDDNDDAFYYISIDQYRDVSHCVAQTQ